MLDGYSRSLVHWELRASMTEAEIVLQRAREKYPEAKPRVISGNGPQFIARDFKEFIRIAHDARENFAVLSLIERQTRAVAIRISMA